MDPINEKVPTKTLVARCIIRIKNSPQFLLVRRAENDSHSAGKWECPGGKIENRETLEEACEKEVFEETGIRINRIYKIAQIEDHTSTEGMYTGRRFITYFAVSEIKTKPAVTLSTEHDSYVWVTWAEAALLELTQQTEKALRDKFLVPHS